MPPFRRGVPSIFMPLCELICSIEKTYDSGVRTRIQVGRTAFKEGDEMSDPAQTVPAFAFASVEPERHSFPAESSLVLSGTT